MRRDYVALGYKALIGAIALGGAFVGGAAYQDAVTPDQPETVIQTVERPMIHDKDWFTSPTGANCNEDEVLAIQSGWPGIGCVHGETIAQEYAP